MSSVGGLDQPCCGWKAKGRVGTWAQGNGVHGRVLNLCQGQRAEGCVCERDMILWVQTGNLLSSATLKMKQPGAQATSACTKLY
jgi:hypothetical protein